MTDAATPGANPRPEKNRAPAPKHPGPDAIERIKLALLAGQTPSPEDVKTSEQWHRRTHQHGSVPTPLAMVLAFGNLTPEERERLRAIQHGETTAVPEGGPGRPVGPGKDPAADARDAPR
jgi:hypothetical protein